MEENEHNNMFFPLLSDTEENESSTKPEESSVFSDLEHTNEEYSSNRNWKAGDEGRLTPLEELYLVRMDKQTCVVFLKSSQRLGIKGRGYMKVLGGEVSIHGNIFEREKKWIYVGSSAWDPLLIVDSEDTVEHCFQDIPQRDSSKDRPLQGLSWLENAVREDPYLSPFSSILTTESVQSYSAVKAIIAFRSYNCWKVSQLEPCVFHSQDSNFERLVDGLFLYRNGDIQQLSHFVIWDGWKELQMSIEPSCACLNSRVFFVCGDRGAGKSTVIRSLCNRLLKFHRRVWLLDTDLGQSERMPPGMVSLVDIKTFFQSTPLTHETYDSLISYFIGVVTPRERPQIYKEAIQILASEMFQRANRAGEPCVVNTHGWTTGLGLSILQFLFQLLQPTDAIQVGMKDNISKLPDHWFDCCCHNGSLNSIRKWNLIRYPLANSNSSSGGDRTSSSEKRHLQLISYFCPEALRFLSPPSSAFSQKFAYQIGNHFAQLPVYKVLLKDMQIYSIDGIVNVERIDTLLLGVVVGLCWNLEQADSLKDCEPLRCFGLGLVKAMESDGTVLYISTPVCENKLQHVNTLVVSRFIQLPPAAYLWTGPTESSFVSWDGLSYVSSEMRSRNNIPRRRFLNKKDTQT